MKHWRYLKYVLRHKWYVFVECCKLGIPWRGIVHDLSKFRRSEWKAYAQYFYGDNNHGLTCFTISSDGLSGPPWGWKIEDRFDLAWLLHQHRNPHHWQYWLLREDDGGTKCIPMPDQYVREMVADWRGAGKAIHGKDDTSAWYAKNKTKIVLHPETRRRVHELLEIEP